MEEKLSKEEVLHVADLARIEIDENEIEVYQIKLKELLNQVEKIGEINDHNSSYLIAPWENKAEYREDREEEMLNPKEVLRNVPRKSGNYIEVPVVINE